jgi:transcriptional regulator with XRE-family HTH domain
MKFGEIIKKKRLLKGYTQDDVAKMLNKTISDISAWEGRRGENPSLKSMQLFANNLDLSFYITKNEELKAWDCYQPIDPLNVGIDPELESFIKDKNSEKYLRLALMIKECEAIGGLESYPVKKYYEDTIKFKK